MSDGFLRIRYADDGGFSGELIAHAGSDCFSGIGRAYFNLEEIEKFAAAIVDYPLSNAARPAIAGGYLSATGRRGELKEEHLGITVYPINSRGDIGIQVRMATPTCEGDRPESREAASVELVTTYEPLSRFSRELIAVLHGNTDEAVLIGGTR